MPGTLINLPFLVKILLFFFIIVYLIRRVVLEKIIFAGFKHLFISFLKNWWLIFFSSLW